MKARTEVLNVNKKSWIALMTVGLVLVLAACSAKAPASGALVPTSPGGIPANSGNMPAPSSGVVTYGAPSGVAEVPVGRPDTAPSSWLLAETAATSGITVAGEGEVKGLPDIAYINVGVQTARPTAKEAQAETSQLMNAIVAKLKSMGVADKDMQTFGISIYPMMDRPGTVTRYQASNQVRITVQDIAKTGELFDAAIASGANTGGQIQFGFKDDSKMRLDALTAATRSAREKADAIAKGLGVSISGVESATEEFVYAPGLTRDAMPAVASKGMDAAPVMGGELSVTARVRVVFKFQ